MISVGLEKINDRYKRFSRERGAKMREPEVAVVNVNIILKYYMQSKICKVVILNS